MMRSTLLTYLAGAAVLLLAAATDAEEKPPTADKYWVFVGTYTGGKSKGIYRLEFDPVKGTLTPNGVAAETPSPSFLAVHPSQKFLYAVNEVGSFDGQKTGSVSAFAIDQKTGALTPLNQQPSGGADPCYIIVDPTGKNALVANYSGGSLEVLPIAPDGKLGTPSAVVTPVSVSSSRRIESL